MTTIPIHVGEAPDAKDFSLSQQDEYYELVRKMPKLQDQGDGMRSFASILLNTFTSDYSITMIDEPEAFLHPPQARIIGRILAKNSNNRQVFISTHSEDFLQGLLDANNDSVTVIRIDRNDSVNRISVLNKSKIKSLWQKPLLRYSNILNGLFHERVVVCESDYDCLFYQAIVNAIYEYDNKVSPDILFVHCGGKHRVHEAVSALKSVNVPTKAILDFDVLNASNVLRPLIESFGSSWESIMNLGLKTIYDEVNAKGGDEWHRIKNTGKNGLFGKAPAAYEKVESEFKSFGLFVVPVGEMEDFDKTINKDKKDWVYWVLENYDLAIEAKLSEARAFVEGLI